MKWFKKSMVILMAAAMLFVSLGCQKDEGPAERAGKDMDKAVEKTKKMFE